MHLRRQAVLRVLSFLTVRRGAFCLWGRTRIFFFFFLGGGVKEGDQFFFSVGQMGVPVFFSVGRMGGPEFFDGQRGGTKFFLRLLHNFMISARKLRGGGKISVQAFRGEGKFSVLIFMGDDDHNSPEWQILSVHDFWICTDPLP